MRSNTVFIDGDTLAFQAACAKVEPEDDAVQIVLGRVKNSLQGILDACEATDYKLYLSDDNRDTFRKTLNPEYKQNRPVEKPVLLETARAYMLDVWKGEIWKGLEADDAVAIEQTACKHKGIIAAVDKDLLQVPGRVYNFKKRYITDVSPVQGAYQLYKQALMGDKTDNIKGLSHCGDQTMQKYYLHHTARAGCGEVAANKILLRYHTEEEFYLAVHDAYLDTYGKSEYMDRLVFTMNMVYIIREYNQGPVLWRPPV